ncbi:NmrA family transcriptional regulator [Fulvivirga sp. M361]|uniref:SDR family oxidoreductase n=1 Tax=Fulvivirga sp. M361 TaxID=2594266 RepID=UPI001179FFF3|nr:NAD(P)H-binding protein [Fulvivirga sp. M361]TRX61707.1 NmrA family transcriptional regulator [Fulvivirga sp. M361]
MESKKVLVLGGTGKTGRKVAKKLTDLNQSVRIGSRNESPAFDWEAPETWEGALDGMDAVYITFQPDLAVPGAVEAIKRFTAQAVSSGVKKMVLLSGRGEKEAELSEEVVINAGVDWTIVRADWFNQNFSEDFFLDPVLAGHLALPRAEVLVPFVDTDDIADVVVASLLYPDHNGKVYELTGPRLLTFGEVVEEISKATGRDIKFQSITMEAYTKMLSDYQVPKDYIWLINYLFTEVLDGRNSNTTDDLERVLGRKAKDFVEYVNETATTGVWTPSEK